MRIFWGIVGILGFVSLAMAQEGEAVLYFYRGDPARTMSEADIFMVDHLTTNVIKLTKKYRVVTRETLKGYLLSQGKTNLPSGDISPAFAQSNAEAWGLSSIVEMQFFAGAKRGIFDIQLRIYDAVEGRYTYDEKVPAQGGRNIFDAMDKVSLALGETLTGRRLGFGGLRVSTTLTNAFMLIDGIEYETSSVVIENALAGLTHDIVIGTTLPSGRTNLFSKSFVIQDGFTYDLTYHHEAWVEVIDLRTNTNRMPLASYKPVASGGSPLQFGPFVRVGMGSFDWVGAYLSWQSMVVDLSLGYIPKLKGDYPIYSHTIGMQGLVLFRLFDADESWWNVGMVGGLTAYAGVYPYFFFYQGLPYVTVGGTLSIRWNFSWVPSWLRRMETELIVGVFGVESTVPMMGITVRY